MSGGIDPVKGRYTLCNTLRYFNPCNVKEDANKTLEEWDDVCKGLGIPHILISGTCLGFYREGGYIENDNDIDTAVICTEVEYKVMLTALREVRFYVGDAVGFKREVMVGLKRIPGGLPPWTYVYPYKKEPQTFIFEKFDVVIYNSREYSVMHPVEDYLKWVYGDWKTPRLRPT